MSLQDLITVEDVEIAFNLLLGRSAGPQGLEHFKQHAVDLGWNRQTLRDAIMTSDEYRGMNERSLQFDGFSLFVNPSEPDFGKHLAAHNGNYEEHNLQIIRNTLREGDTFVDIGANIGLLSLTARSAVGDSGKVICFEPMASNAALLIKSIIANDFNNVVVYPVALSDQARTLYLEGNSNGMLLAEGRVDRKMTTVIGDDYLEQEERIDFLKIDIEGHEPFAMRGIAKTLRRCTPVVMCEFNPIMLRSTSQSNPAEFAEQVFAMTHELQAIDYDGNIVVVSDVDSLLGLWTTKNRHYTDQGRILEGYLHFDLLFRAAPR